MINGPGINGIFRIFGINGQIAKKNIVLPLLTDLLVKKQDIQKAYTDQLALIDIIVQAKSTLVLFLLQ